MNRRLKSQNICCFVGWTLCDLWWFVYKAVVLNPRRGCDVIAVVIVKQMVSLDWLMSEDRANLDSTGTWVSCPGWMTQEVGNPIWQSELWVFYNTIPWSMCNVMHVNTPDLKGEIILISLSISWEVPNNARLLWVTKWVPENEYV